MAVPQKLEKYCSDFTEKIITNSFPKNRKITGEEILSFSPVKQLNLFIIKNLLIEWQREIEKLKSPYFNFESEEVKSAMKDFGNTLSRNISISEEDFKPLVYQSTWETITLLTTPYEFYIGIANLAIEKNYTIPELQSIQKYIKHNQFIYTEFLKEITSESYSPEAYPAVVEGVMKHTDQTPEDPEPFFKLLSGVLPFDQTILNEEEQIAEPEEEKIASEPTPVIDLYSDESKEGGTLNDRLMNDSKSLADVHQEQKINDIRSSLNLNQKFMFINGLFDGDENRFNSTLDKIEGLSSLEEAKSILQKDFGWDDSQEEVFEFYELLAKRLA